MKSTRIFKMAGRYWYFIVGVLAVLLGYGLVRAFRQVIVRPEAGLPEVQRIGYERFVLTNGLELIVHRDSSAPTVSVNMSYRIGSRDEPRGKTGLAHLTEHLMLEAGGRQTAGTESVVDRLGAWDYNGSTDRDRTRLYMTVPKQALDAALWIESERMAYLADKLTAESLTAARQDVLNELRRNESGADAAFEAAITEAVFPAGHPYSHLPGGKREDVETITFQDVTQWLKSYYKPNKATLVIAGDVDIAAVRSRVETYFGAVPGGPRSQELVSQIPQYESLHRHATASIPNGTLVFIWSLPGQGSPELDYLDLARHVLEGRLTQRLVRQDRVANSVRLDFKPYHLCSLLVLKVEMNAQGTESNVLSSIKQELTDLTTNDAALLELNEAKRGILVSLLFTSERVGGAVSKAEILASAATLTGNAADFNLTLERVRNAAPNDVKTAAAAWLSLDVATLVTHGPKVERETGATSVPLRPPTMPAVYTDQVETQINIAPERTDLPNGLTIMAVKRSGPVGGAKLVWPKTSQLTITDEQLIKVTSNLLSEGAGSLRKSELQDALGRTSMQFVLEDTPNYYALGLELPSQYLSRGLEVLSGLVVGVKFDESQVAAVRGQWERRLKGAGPSSWKLYLSTLMRLISTDRFEEARRLDCGPLQSFTVADVQRTYETKFRPDAATLIIIGDVNPASLKEEATRLFQAWHSADGGQDKRGLSSPSAKSQGAPIYIVDRPGADYAVTVTGLVSGELEAGGPASYIVTTLLDSRANRVLREETQVAHETFAGHEGWVKSGLMYVYADARSEQVPKALDLAEQVLRPPDNRDSFCETEFRRARTSAAKRSLQALESTRSLMDFLTVSAIAPAHESQVGSISCEDVLNVSHRMTNGATLIRLVMGDSKRLAQVSRTLGQQVEVLERPCWVSLY